MPDVNSVGALVYLTREEMAAMDKAATDEFGIDVLVLMENAGLATAGVGREMLGGKVLGRRISVLVGKGNNGGDGLVAARHLRNWGARVVVVLAEKREDIREVPSRQLAAVERMGAEIVRSGSNLSRSELIIDALLGYSSTGNPRGAAAELVQEANGSGVAILAVDLPSGLDATSGEPGQPCIKAERTVTFGLPKTGFLNPMARRYTGEISLADISIPVGLYHRFGQRSSPFLRGPLVMIRKPARRRKANPFERRPPEEKT